MAGLRFVLTKSFTRISRRLFKGTAPANHNVFLSPAANEISVRASDNHAKFTKPCVGIQAATVFCLVNVPLMCLPLCFSCHLNCGDWPEAETRNGPSFLLKKPKDCYFKERNSDLVEGRIVWGSISKPLDLERRQFAMAAMQETHSHP